MRTPPLLADFIHPIACKPKCEKLLTLPGPSRSRLAISRRNTPDLQAGSRNLVFGSLNSSCGSISSMAFATSGGVNTSAHPARDSDVSLLSQFGIESLDELVGVGPGHTQLPLHIVHPHETVLVQILLSLNFELLTQAHLSRRLPRKILPSDGSPVVARRSLFSISD